MLRRRRLPSYRQSQDWVFGQGQQIGNVSGKRGRPGLQGVGTCCACEDISLVLTNVCIYPIPWHRYDRNGEEEATIVMTASSTAINIGCRRKPRQRPTLRWWRMRRSCILKRSCIRCSGFLFRVETTTTLGNMRACFC